MLHHLASLVFNTCIRLQFEIYRFWISLHRFIFQQSNATSSNNNIVIIGDLFGFGLGDSFFTCESAGIGYSLYYQIQIEQSIRTQWNIFNYSSCKSTTNNWLPVTDTAVKPSLFERNKGNIYNSSIVLVFMGTQDVLEAFEKDEPLMPQTALSRNIEGAVYPPEEISSIVSNTLKICTELQSMKKHVIVIDLPTEGLPFGRGKMKRVNQQLKQVIIEQNSKISSDGYHEIQLVSLGNNHRIMRPAEKEDTHCRFNSLYLNRKGYALLSQFIFQNLKDVIVNVEWMKWKGLFHGHSKEKVEASE